jgi:glycosyltransferase involved in cell wall biosynthesis
VLAAPAGYTISDKTGTDPTISYELLRTLSESMNAKIYAIANRVDVEVPLPRSIKLVETDVERGGGISEQILFMANYYRIAKKLLHKMKFSVIHHITFQHGNFNPLFIWGPKDVSFVIGPAYYDPPIPSELMEGMLATRWGRSWSDIYSPREILMRGISFRLISSLNFLRQRLFLETLDRCDAIVAVNNATKNFYSQLTSSRKIEVIPIGVKSQSFTFTTPPNNYDILAPANLIKIRGVQYIIEAMPKLLKDFKDARLHIVGDGPQRSELVRQAERLGVAAHVEFHGRVSHKEILDYYRKCRLMCLASLHHTFGNVAIEAMASGRPVVTTDTVGPREIVIDNVTGFIVPRADSEALELAIRKVFSDYALTCKMGSEGRKIVEKIYDWEIVARKYYDIYERLT